MNAPLQPFIRAVAFAAEKHRHQRRKDALASPYINHPIELADFLVSEGGVTDLDVLMAAVLHDTVEDTETTRAELATHFGERIAGIVMEVTDDKTLHKDTRKRLQVEHAPRLSREAKLVKLADKICNLRDILASPPSGWPVQRKLAYFDWAKAVVDGLRGINEPLEILFDATYRRKTELD
ncbi:MAG: bifunctional (p)ppGpp synthetase/guanosine-3',5'-bis(diphosphate) 3'-pyrophosphohydrolase [Methylococcus sp.]|nr:MAG: bifunctional (p)ppGpp synthetase/guanosine-3',5'-bis(diphosphate) 3'-pyrophosphohydrolase [Methylococcus sp.]